jgi:hypothetical protein
MRARTHAKGNSLSFYWSEACSEKKVAEKDDTSFILSTVPFLRIMVFEVIK